MTGLAYGFEHGGDPDSTKVLAGLRSNAKIPANVNEDGDPTVGRKAAGELEAGACKGGVPFCEVEGQLNLSRL